MHLKAQKSVVHTIQDIGLATRMHAHRYNCIAMHGRLERTNAVSFTTRANVLHRNKAIVQNTIEYITLTKKISIILSVRIDGTVKNIVFIAFAAKRVSSTCTAS